MLESLSSKLLQLTLSQKKINLISYEPMVHISDIKLIRTDTTLDLSQKAEKGMILTLFHDNKFVTIVYVVLFYDIQCRLL
ncbi:hypothetical protein PHAVU_011G191100 [Phaseolus vulgaris]